MSRLFVFGCSFTCYRTPTWADILSFSYDQYYNLGKGGSGNQCIFETLCDAVLRYNIRHGDTVIVMWTSYHRQDFFKSDRWHTPGNVYNSPKVFDDEYIRNYIDVKGMIMHSLNFISAAEAILAQSKADWYMTSMSDMLDPFVEFDGITKFWPWSNRKTILDKFPSFKIYKETLNHNRWLPLSMLQFNAANKYPKNKHYFRNKEKTAIDEHLPVYVHYQWLLTNDFCVDKKAYTQLYDKWIRTYNQLGYLVIIDNAPGNTQAWIKDNIPYVVRDCVTYINT